MKNIILILVIIVISSCTKSWVKTGHVNPDNCNEFIVNDSLTIKPGGCECYALFINGVESFDVFAYKELFESDSEMIDHIEWQYGIYLDRPVTKNMRNRSKTCIEIK